MLRFDKVEFLYILWGHKERFQVQEINTSMGYANVDVKRKLFWFLTYAWAKGIPQIPSYYVEKGEDLYLMKEEPCYYA